MKDSKPNVASMLPDIPKDELSQMTKKEFEAMVHDRAMLYLDSTAKEILKAAIQAGPKGITANEASRISTIGLQKILTTTLLKVTEDNRYVYVKFFTGQ
jgi:hypothetical protein